MCITFILYFFFEIKSIFLLLSCVSRFLFDDKVLLLLRPDESSTQTRSKRCPDPIVLHIVHGLARIRKTLMSTAKKEITNNIHQPPHKT